MLQHVSHASGVLAEGEILFDTHFGYMFDHLCREKDCLLPHSPQTASALMELGALMVKGRPGVMVDPENDGLDSGNASIFTFLGQFIDHDITARTDRNGNVTNISNPDGTAKHIDPSDPDFVTAHLKNGRRPQLDLDSVFGDGPGLMGKRRNDKGEIVDTYRTEASIFYEENLKLKIQTGNGIFDLPRKIDEEVKLGTCDALIADARNDENLILSQLHAVFIAAYNKIYDELPAGTSNEEKYIQGRKLLSWAYQFIVLNEYLSTVCNPEIVRDTLTNGPYYFNLSKGIFMPLEFSVAGFRFGHSMIRHKFAIRGSLEKTIGELLNFKMDEDLFQNEEDKDGPCRVKANARINWDYFTGNNVKNFARKIDPKIVKGLFDLDNRPPNHILAKLTQRNLMRGYSLSIPTGQSVAKAMQIVPLKATEILENKDFTTPDKNFLIKSCFTQKTPLWFYILQEAHVHANGETLGAVGSRLVAETLTGLVKYDPNSYLNNRDHAAIDTDRDGKVEGISLPGRTSSIKTIRDLINYAT